MPAIDGVVADVVVLKQDKDYCNVVVDRLDIAVRCFFFVWLDGLGLAYKIYNIVKYVHGRSYSL